MKKLIIKVTMSEADPFDADVIPFLEAAENKAAWLRKAAFCYVQGLSPRQVSQTVPIPTPTTPLSAVDEKEQKLNDRLSKLAI